MPRSKSRPSRQTLPSNQSSFTPDDSSPNAEQPSHTIPPPRKRRRLSSTIPSPLYIPIPLGPLPTVTTQLPDDETSTIDLTSSQFNFYLASQFPPCVTHLCVLVQLHLTWVPMQIIGNTLTTQPALLATLYKQQHLLLVLLPKRVVAVIEGGACLLPAIQKRVIVLSPAGGTDEKEDPLVLNLVVAGGQQKVSIWKDAAAFLVNVVNGGRLQDGEDMMRPKSVYKMVKRARGDDDSKGWERFLKDVRVNAASSLKLRPYQRRAVAWMIGREEGEIKNIDVETVEAIDDVGIVEEALRECMKKKVIIQPLEGWIRFETNKRVMIRPFDVDRGGLLCDEMGLGKTVEFLTLIMCNRSDEICTYTSKMEKQVLKRVRELKGWCSICHNSCDNLYPTTRKKFGIPCEECGTLAHEDCLLHEGCAVLRKGYVCTWCCNRMKYYSQSTTPSEQVPATNATLIVVPSALLLQWKREIGKHVNENVKIQLFEGLKRSPYLARKQIMDLDVVITTYNALKDDINTFNAFRSPRSGLRNNKRFRASPVPLLSIRWRRVAFDESQMIASGKSQAGIMARHLRATFRWCITGTPISSSLRDMVPLLQLIQSRHKSNLIPWDELVKPTCFEQDKIRLQKYLRSVMWRTQKQDLEEDDELNIPKQTIQVLRTDFGPIERYNYYSILRRARAASIETKQDNHSQQDIATISRDLVMMLRQAACHPQVGISGADLSRSTMRMLNRTRTDSRQRKVAEDSEKPTTNPLSMDSVLDSLLSKALLEAEDTLRSYVASSNGLAGIHFIMFHSAGKNYDEKVENLRVTVGQYRECLKWKEENKQILDMDTIQYMHILHNLSEAFAAVLSTRDELHGGNTAMSPFRGKNVAELKQKIEKLIPKAEECQYEQKARELQQDYINEAKEDLEQKHAKLKETTEALGEKPLETGKRKTVQREEDESQEEEEERKEETRRGSYQWWEFALGFLIEESRGDVFITLLCDTLLNGIPANQLMAVPTLARRISSIHTLTTVIDSELEKLHEARNEMVNHLSTLPGFGQPTLAEIVQSGNCSSCRDFGKGPPCVHCRSEKVLYEVEKRLYFLRDDRNIKPKRKPPRRRNRNLAFAEALTEVQLDIDIQGVTSSAPRSYNTRQSYARFTGELETIFKVLANDLRKRNDSTHNEQITKFFEKFEILKQELKEVTAVFEAQRTLLARMDEVNMAISRLSLRENEDNMADSEFESRTCITKKQIAPLRLTYVNEVRTYTSMFVAKRTAVTYLRNLTNNPEQSNNKGELENGQKNQCPICLGPLQEDGNKLAILKCAHAFCSDCIKGFIQKRRNHSKKEIPCPICRCNCDLQDINYTTEGEKTESSNVDNSEKETNDVEMVSANNASSDASTEAGSSASHAEADGVINNSTMTDTIKRIREERLRNEKASTFYDASAEVNGNPGAKQSAIIRLLRGIWQKDENAKVIIFSEWLDMLQLTSRALLSNGIDSLSCRSSSNPRAFAKMIDKFRTNATPKVVLLQLRHAAAGLNLTEASHIILCEPVVDVAVEDQALSRIHRMGQTKLTYVHRLISNNTVEDTLMDFAERQRQGILASNETRSNPEIEFEDIIETIHI